MEKKIIMLAASRKYENLCVAGIDISSGEWIRIISEDNGICHAVKEEDMLYEDGSIPEILDIIKIKCIRQEPNYFQPENYVFDSNYYWKRIGKAEIKDVLKIHPIEKKDFIFYDSNKRIHKDVLNGLPVEAKYSLTLIAPTNIIVHVRQWPERKTVTMSFNYIGNSYRYLSVTDIDFENMYLNYTPGDYGLSGKVFLVLSLGECYNKDNNHYKLVATVIK